MPQLLPLSALGQSSFAPAIDQVGRLKDLYQTVGGAGKPAQDPNFARNSAYAIPQASYQTTLDPQTEQAFQQWVKQNNVPFDPSPTADYDMRGFYQGLMSGNPNAQTGVNQNDGKLHFSDYWKTPYHQSFSNESQWAVKGKAPKWNDKDQLVLPSGQVVFDERAK